MKICTNPKAIQNAPHIPCARVATTSRALDDHMPAANCAMPPNVIANSPTTPMSVQWPTQPAWIRATMHVATENPARPSADGAAIGRRDTRGRAKPSRHSPSSRSATPAEACSLRSSIVLMRVSFPSYYVVLFGCPSTRPQNLPIYIAFRVYAALRVGKNPSGGALEAPRVLARTATAAGGGSAGARQGGPVASLADARAPHRRGRARRSLDLPLLRRRLRTARVRQGRRRHPHRRRSREPDLTRPALSEGAGLEELRAEPAARVQGQVPAAVRDAVGEALARRRDGNDRRADHQDARRHLGVGDR